MTSRSFGSGLARPDADLAEAGFRVVRGDPRHDLRTLEPLLAEAVGWIAGIGPVTDRHISAAPRLTVLARYGAGVDAVDLVAARRRGIVVTHAPGANTEAVADHTVALMLAALRHVVEGDRLVRSGQWPPLRGRELGALTVGLIGFGRIGQAVSRRVTAFGSRLIVADPVLEPAAATAAGVELLPAEQLLLEADVVSLHVPGGRMVLDAGAVSTMAPGAVVVNTSRADVVDERALAVALREGRLGAVASDVVDAEQGGGGPLLEAPRTVLTPHCAGLTTESVDRLGTVTAGDVLRVLRGEAPRFPVPSG